VLVLVSVVDFSFVFFLLWVLVRFGGVGCCGGGCVVVRCGLLVGSFFSFCFFGGVVLWVCDFLVFDGCWVLGCCGWWGLCGLVFFILRFFFCGFGLYVGFFGGCFGWCVGDGFVF